MKTWKELVKRLSLTRSEKEVLEAWKVQQTSKTCLDLYLVFKEHSKAKEASELLSWSLSFQPENTDQLVRLGREFFELGSIHDAWYCLHRDLFRVKQNPVGLNTLFHCALALGKETEMQSFMSHIQKEGTWETLGEKILKTYNKFGFEASQRALVQHFLDRRISLQVTRSPQQSTPDIMKNLSSPLSMKSGICSLRGDKEQDESGEDSSDRARLVLLKRLEKTEQRLEYLRHLKRQLKGF